MIETMLNSIQKTTYGVLNEFDSDLDGTQLVNNSL